jgi:hypothetical protein
MTNSEIFATDFASSFMPSDSHTAQPILRARIGTSHSAEPPQPWTIKMFFAHIYGQKGERFCQRRTPQVPLPTAHVYRRDRLLVRRWKPSALRKPNFNCKRPIPCMPRLPNLEIDIRSPKMHPTLGNSLYGL